MFSSQYYHDHCAHIFYEWNRKKIFFLLPAIGIWIVPIRTYITHCSFGTERLNYLHYYRHFEIFMHSAFLFCTFSLCKKKKKMCIQLKLNVTSKKNIFSWLAFSYYSYWFYIEIFMLLRVNKMWKILRILWQRLLIRGSLFMIV